MSIYRMSKHGTYLLKNDRKLYNWINESDEIADLLNNLTEENEQLKSELKIYRKVANCGNCHYHNYDWYDDGDEFEVCDKGNDMSDRICEDWEEL